MTLIKCMAILLAYLLTGCGKEFTCPVKVDIISQDHDVRMAYLAAMDWLNTETGEFIFTIGQGDIRVFGWSNEGGQAKGSTNLAFITEAEHEVQKIVAAHELLHLLGIRHDELNNSLMNPIVGISSDIQPTHIEQIYAYCGY